MTGDLLPHIPVIRAAEGYGAETDLTHDFRPMFEPVADVLGSADLALCHLEVPLDEDPSRFSGFPIFNGPADLAPSIADSGWDGCSTAHNHSVDQGFEGITRTLDLLEDAGLGAAGTARTEEEAAAITTYEVEDTEVAHLSYTYGLNGLPVPADAPWSVNLIDRDRIAEDAEKARDEGADVVAVSLHWGQEYRHEPTEEQRSLAEDLDETADIDVIIGHHAHVVQPIEEVGSTLVVYGLGNFLSNQSPACCAAGAQDGMIVTVDLVEDLDGGLFEVDGVNVLPTWVDRSTYRVLPADDRLLGDTDTPDLAAALEAAHDRTMSVVGWEESREPPVSVTE